jgi:hypothetical protein
MKRKQLELDVDFIGGERPLTEEDKIAISAFIRAHKKKHTRKPAAHKRTMTTSRKKMAA